MKVKIKLSGGKFAEWEEILTDKEIVGYTISQYKGNNSEDIYQINLIQKGYEK